MGSLSLAQRLYSLRLQDGRLDSERRKLELDNLIHYLSGAEINHLVNTLTQSTSKNERFCNLPNEIILAIMDHLDLEDVVVARSVSQRWYMKWTELEICFGIAERYFPDVLFRSYMPLPDEQKKGAKVTLSKWASKKAADVVKGQHGHYRSVSVHPREKAHLSSATYMEIRYCNGRVAEVVSSYEVIVKSLRTGESKVYMREDRAPILKWWLTDQLIVTSNRHTHNELTAWYLDKDESHTVRLTSRCLNITARGRYVGFQIQTEPFIWQVGGQLTNVKTPGIPVSYLGQDWWPAQILFHPVNEDHFFLFHRDRAGDTDFEVMVQEYINNEPKSMYSSKIAMPLTGENATWMAGACLMSCYEVEVSQAMGEALQNTAPCSHARSYPDTIGSPLVVHTLTFDVFTKTFSTRIYNIPGLFPINDLIWEPSIQQSNIWRNQLLLPAHIGGSDKGRKPPSVDEILVIAIKPCDRIQEVPNIIPWYVQDSSDEKRILFLENDPEFQKCGVSFCWAAGGELAQTARLNFDPPDTGMRSIEPVVYGDDDFVVMVGENGHIVWSFDDQNPPPSTA
ncbi:hypothetical protein F5884DRAFT_764098 [Xylogone sp. PMI_703]|nr:hypothetical protein F5884DRAFT_764098 [Xylogone sp. PMI_703]